VVPVGNDPPTGRRPLAPDRVAERSSAAWRAATRARICGVDQRPLHRREAVADLGTAGYQLGGYPRIGLVVLRAQSQRCNCCLDQVRDRIERRVEDELDDGGLR